MKLVDPHTDPWHALGGDDGPPVTIRPTPFALLDLAQWHAARDHWPAALPVGVALPNDLDPAELADDLPRLALVALRFPKWTDGRAYSQAVLLRRRLGYAGEVRATGDVMVDMLPLLHRTGFASAQLRADQSLASAERTLSFFGQGHYQGDVGPVPPLSPRVPAPVPLP
jgi:uncharacterized protein (DUF934 family)